MSGARFSVSVAASLLGVAVSTLYRWIHRGTVEVDHTPGGQLLVPASEIDRLRDLCPDVLRGDTENVVECGCFGDKTRQRGSAT